MAFIDNVADPRTRQLLEQFSADLGQNTSSIVSYGSIDNRIPTNITYSTNEGSYTRDTSPMYGKYLNDSEIQSVRAFRLFESENQATPNRALRPAQSRFRQVRNFDQRGIDATVAGVSGIDLGSTGEARLAASGIPEGAQFGGNTGYSKPAVIRPAKFDSDHRVRIADNSGLLVAQGGLLNPLRTSGFNGVIFPYTPNISVSYTANYNGETLTHSNYEYMFYQSSSVSELSISGKFTARNEKEAAYVLASQHFFRTVTKMFYGQDSVRGLPPVVLRLSGHGDFQFNNVPVVVTGFSQSYPDDVDYITTAMQGISSSVTGGLGPGGGGGNISGQTQTFTSRVPTMQEFNVTCKPLYSRSSITNEFGLTRFANGGLLLKGFI